MFEYLTVKWILIVAIVVVLNTAVFIGSLIFHYRKDKQSMRKFLKSLRPQGKIKK
jgi:hypothetical protein